MRVLQVVRGSVWQQLDRTFGLQTIAVANGPAGVRSPRPAGLAEVPALRVPGSPRLGQRAGGGRPGLAGGAPATVLVLWGHEADDYGGCVVLDSPLEVC